jgi:hypothetical protein
MSITTLNPPSPYAQSVEAARLAKLFANASELTGSLITIDNRQIPLQLVPVYVASITKDVLSKLEEGCDAGLSEQIYENLTAAFEALKSREACPEEESQEREPEDRGLPATVSFAPKAA